MLDPDTIKEIKHYHFRKVDITIISELTLVPIPMIQKVLNCEVNQKVYAPIKLKPPKNVPKYTKENWASFCRKHGYTSTARLSALMARSPTYIHNILRRNDRKLGYTLWKMLKQRILENPIQSK